MYLHKHVSTDIFTAISNSPTVFPPLQLPLCPHISPPPYVTQTLYVLIPTSSITSPLVPDIPLPSLSLMSPSGNLSLLGTLVHLYCFWILLNAVLCILFIFLHLVSLSQCEGPSMWLQVTRSPWCFWMSHHPLYVCSLSSVFICEWTFWGVSNACLFWGALQETLGFRCLEEGWFSLDSGPAVQFADLLVGAFFTYEQPYRLCFQRGCNSFRSMQQHRGVLFSPHGENL